MSKKIEEWEAKINNIGPFEIEELQKMLDEYPTPKENNFFWWLEGYIAGVKATAEMS